MTGWNRTKNGGKGWERAGKYYGFDDENNEHVVEPAGSRVKVQAWMRLGLVVWLGLGLQHCCWG